MTVKGKLTLGQQLSPEKRAALELLMTPKKFEPSEKKQPPQKGQKNQLKTPKKTGQEIMQELNQQAVEEKMKRIKETIEWLCDKFPACFSQTDPRPLKLGILTDVFEAIDFSAQGVPTKTCVRKSVGCYAKSAKYLKAILQGKLRVDLNGVEDEAGIEDKHREYTQQLIAKLSERKQEQKKEQAEKRSASMEKEERAA